MKKLLVMSFIMVSVMFSFAEIGTRTMDGNIEVQDNNTETFKVYGNCGMCKRRIEGALKGVKGVEKADWDKETKMIQVTYDPEIISLKEINQKIADSGHDTDEVKAKDKTYNNLPGCCQYNRPENKGKHHNHQH